MPLARKPPWRPRICVIGLDISHPRPWTWRYRFSARSTCRQATISTLISLCQTPRSVDRTVWPSAIPAVPSQSASFTLQVPRPVEIISDNPLEHLLRSLYNYDVCPARSLDSSEDGSTHRTNRWVVRCRQSILNRQAPHAIRVRYQNLDKQTNQLELLLCQRLRKFLAHPDVAHHDHQRPHLNPAPHATLQRCGYKPRDLHKWTRALTCMHPRSSAQLLLSHCATSRPPSFVLFAFLRRRNLDHQVLANVVRYLSTYSETVVLSIKSLGPAKSNIEHDIMLLDALTFVFQAYHCLVRHARSIWPEAFEHLSHNFITTSSSLINAYKRSVIRPFALLHPLVTFMYNELLSCIATPCSIAPLKNSVFQEAAGNALLQHMSACSDSVVELNPHGYRAVLRIQLMRPKTAREQVWAQLKSPAWPPWKTDRTGMDALVTPEHGISRAGKVASMFKEAGFATDSWDAAAMIYAGWDTDGSPAIQTRTVMPIFSDTSAEGKIWAARIRCTRNIQESWACFLASEDSHVEPDASMYLAMLEKASAEAVRLQSISDNRDDKTNHRNQTETAIDVPLRKLYPGDTREISGPPANVQHETYTRISPPTLESLTQHMHDKKIVPKAATLALLIDNSTTVEEAIRHLQHPANGVDCYYRSLVHLDDRTGVDRVPGSVLTAWIRLLTTSRTMLDRCRELHLTVGRLTLESAHPLVHAYRLLLACRDVPRSAHNALLRGLSLRAGVGLAHALHESHHDTLRLDGKDGHSYGTLIAAELARSLVTMHQRHSKPVDVDGFRHLCHVIGNASLAAQELQSMPRRRQQPLFRALIKREASNGKYLRGLFQALVGLQEVREQTRYSERPATLTNELVPLSSYKPITSPITPTTLPRLFSFPGPAVLHAYVRALGASRDFDGIVELSLYMKTYWPESATRMAQDRSGNVMMRRVVLAMRAFLQGQCLGTGHGSTLGSSGQCQGKDDRYEAPMHLVERVVEVVESMETWGGWPSADQAREYRRCM